MFSLNFQILPACAYAWVQEVSGSALRFAFTRPMSDPSPTIRTEPRKVKLVRKQIARSPVSRGGYTTARADGDPASAPRTHLHLRLDHATSFIELVAREINVLNTEFVRAGDFLPCWIELEGDVEITHGNYTLEFSRGVMSPLLCTFSADAASLRNRESGRSWSFSCATHELMESRGNTMLGRCTAARPYVLDERWAIYCTSRPESRATG